MNPRTLAKKLLIAVTVLALTLVSGATVVVAFALGMYIAMQVIIHSAL